MPEYGGFWIRFVAYIIDTIILYFATFVGGLVIGLVVGLGMRSGGASTDVIMIVSQLIGGTMGLVASWLYFAILESSGRQATVGKMALGLVVTDEFGRKISFGRATGRYFAKIISSIILLIGFFMIGWTGRKQGLHDMIAGTLVYKSRNPQDIHSSAEVFS